MVASLLSTLCRTKTGFSRLALQLLSSAPCSVCSFTPPHGLTKKMMAEDGWRLLPSLTLIQCQCSARVCRRRGRGWVAGAWIARSAEATGVCSDPELAALISLPWSLPSSPLSPVINQIHRPPWSAVSCYLVTSCHDLPGPLAFPWRLCPSCHLLGCAVPMACIHPGPWPTAACLPASLPHGPVRLSVCVHVAVQPLTVPGWWKQLLACRYGGSQWTDKDSWYNRLQIGICCAATHVASI